MRPRPRRSSNAARPSSASGGCAIALSPTASRKPATACSPSHGCRQVSGEAREQRTPSSVCTKSSSGGSRRRPCCRRQKRQRCCSGRCSPLVRSTCARLMVGRRSPQSPSINRLISPPDQILSKCRRSRHQIPTPLATAPVVGRGPVAREGLPPLQPDLKLDDIVPFRLSRNHFMIEKRDGSYYVRDLCSTLGTIVNGEPIGDHFRGDDAPLRAGENEVIAGGVDSPFVFSVFIA